MRRIFVLLAALAMTAALAVTSALAMTSAHAAEPSRTDQLNLSFSNGTYTSRYHLFAGGLDWGRPVGLMVYFDGSGAYGLNHPNRSYLLDADGTQGLVHTARQRNMILVTPIAPAPGCDYDGNQAPDTGEDSNCWYDGARAPYHAGGKATWAFDLIRQVKSAYPITSHTVAGGFSSGAQAVTQFFGPAYAEKLGIDLTVAIGYGGAPVTNPSYSADYKQRSAWAWNTGTADNAFRTDRYGSVGGHNWYRDNGFTRTHASWPLNVGHDRPNRFNVIMENEMARFLTQPPINTPKPPPAPAPAPAPAPETVTMDNCPNAFGCQRAEVRVLECRVPGNPNRPGKIGVRMTWAPGDRVTRHVRVEGNFDIAQPFHYEGETRQYNNQINTVISGEQPGWNMVYTWTHGRQGSDVNRVVWIPTC